MNGSDWQTQMSETLSTWQKAMMTESVDHFKRMGKIPFLWQQAQKVRKGVTPSEVVYEEDRMKLLHYPSDAPPKYKTPIVFVFALVNRPYILDLKEGRSVVANFVNHGFDTYLVDWGTPTEADKFRTLDDYVNGYLVNVVDFVREKTGAPKVSILGYCMGGTISTMFTSLHNDRVANLILLAAGIDFSTREGLLNLWTSQDNFDVDKFVDTMGNCPAEFLQSAFLMLKPVQNMMEKPINFWENLGNDKFVEDFFTMEAWLNDNIPVPGEVFREFVKYLYQQNLLTQNRMPVGKHIVQLKNIKCPLMNLMARFDDLVPCSQSMILNDLVGSTDRSSIMLDAGHIGLAMGSKAQKELWPKVCQWLAERS